MRKLKDKRSIILIVFCSILLIVTGIFLGNRSEKKISDESIREMLENNQLPSGLFLESVISINSKDKDLYSTLVMYKINTILTKKNTKINFENVNINSISHLQVLMDSEIELDDEQLTQCKEFIEDSEYHKSLIDHRHSDDNYIINLLFTIQSLQFARQYKIEISYFNEVKDIVSKEIIRLNSDVDNVTLYTLLQGAQLFEISINREFIENEILKRMDVCVASEFGNYSSIISLYYMSKLCVEYNIQYNLSNDISNLLMGVISCNYDTLSIFYDVVYVLNSFNRIDTNMNDTLLQIKKHLDSLYYLDEGWYTIITVQTPSIEGTYAAIKLADMVDIELSKKENIKDYLWKIVYSEFFSSLNMSQTLCIYKIGQLLDLDFDNEYREIMKEYFQLGMYNNSIRDLYHFFYLVGLLDLHENYDEDIKLAVNDVIEEHNPINQLNNEELSMILIMLNYYDLENEYDMNNLLDKIKSCNTINDLYYLNEYCNQMNLNDKYKRAIQEQVKKFGNEDGYYASLDIRQITFKSLLIGRIIESTL